MTLKLDVTKLQENRSQLQKAKTAATEELWKRGKFLDLVMHSAQVSMVEAFKASDSIFYVWLCSRRIGKSVGCMGLAVEQALSHPGSRVLYLSKTTDNVAEIVEQAATTVLESCPPSLKPKYYTKENKFVFPNESEIRVKGIDTTGPDAIRGVKADLIILDEFCFMRHLNTLISSVIMPMAIAQKGRILMASSAPDSPGHESLEWIQKAEERGAITVKTIYECPLYTPREIKLFEDESGGVETSTFRREYLCKLEVSREKAIFPAFTDDKVQLLVKEPEPPGYLPQTYVALDIGFRDLTVALFAWWDYENARVVIQDEVVLKGNEATTDNIARAIVDKEYELWRGQTPHKRVCDTDPRLIADLKKINNLHFRPTKKDNKEAQVNQANIMIARDQVLISPKCKTLITHLKYGVWNTNRTDFIRTPALHHCDAADAFLYLIRNLDRGNMPTETFAPSHNQVWHGTQPERITSTSVANMRAAFKRR